MPRGARDFLDVTGGAGNAQSRTAIAIPIHKKPICSSTATNPASSAAFLRWLTPACMGSGETSPKPFTPDRSRTNPKAAAEAHSMRSIPTRTPQTIPSFDDWIEHGLRHGDRREISLGANTKPSSDVGCARAVSPCRSRWRSRTCRQSDMTCPRFSRSSRIT